MTAKVDDCPLQIVLFKVEQEIEGGGLTVTVIVVVAEHPVPIVPVTV